GSSLAELQGLKESNTERVIQLMESLGTSDAPKPLYYYGGE
ncbi:signal peptide peptidase SppA, partial [Enterococcus gallinarum]